MTVPARDSDMLSRLADIRNSSPALAAVQAHLACAAMAWPLRLGAPDPLVDRCAGLLSGPSFASVAHPWPQEGGRWLEPVVQVDMAWLGAVGGQALGAGLAQLWTSDRAAVVRVISTSDVAPALLEPPPSLRAADYHRRTRMDTDDGALSWLTQGRAITGVEAPFLDCDPGQLDYLLGEALAQRPVAAVAALLEAARAEIADVEPRFVHRAFGMASGVQGGATLPRVVLTIEEDRMISWGDGGSGHLTLGADGALRFNSGRM